MTKIRAWELVNQKDDLDTNNYYKVNEFLKDNWTFIEDGLFEVIEGLLYEQQSGYNVPVEQHCEFIEQVRNLYKKGEFKKT